MGHGRFQFQNEFVHGKTKGPLFQIQHNAGEMLRSLDIHVFIIVVIGQLRPKGDIHGKSDFKCAVHILMGHDGHGGGEQVPGNGHGVISSTVSMNPITSMSENQTARGLLT